MDFYLSLSKQKKKSLRNEIHLATSHLFVSLSMEFRVGLRLESRVEWDDGETIKYFWRCLVSKHYGFENRQRELSLVVLNVCTLAQQTVLCFSFFALLCFNREMRERLNFNWVQCFSCVSVWAGFSQLYAKTTSPSFMLKRPNCRIVWCCKSRKKGRFSSHLVSTPPLFSENEHFFFCLAPGIFLTSLMAWGRGGKRSSEGKNFYGWNHHSEKEQSRCVCWRGRKRKNRNYGWGGNVIDGLVRGREVETRWTITLCVFHYKKVS